LKKSTLAVALAIAIILLVRLLILFRLDIFPDEAYYWDWSRFLSLGYFDHPPMVAWLVHITTSIVRDHYWGVKAVPLLLGTGVSVVMALLGIAYLDSTRSVILLVILLNATLLYAVGGLLLTPDIPFLFFWALGIYVGHLAVFRRKTIAWPVLGVVCGLGLLSKYVFALFIAAFGLFLLFDKNQRKLLLTWKPWFSLFLAGATFSPNIFWNARHDWVSYVFQLGHGFASDKTWPHINMFFDYLGGQIGLFSPFLFVVLVMAVVYFLRHFRKEAKLLYLFSFLIVPLLFFAWSSLSAHVEANWPAAAYLSGLVLLMWYWERIENKSRVRKYIAFSIGFTIIISLLVFVHAAFPFLPIPVRQDRSYDPRGWKDFALCVHDIRQESDPQNKMPLCANNYQQTALLAFHSPDQPRTWALNFSSRTNHYAFVKARQDIVDDSLLFVSPVNKKKMPNYLQKYFNSINMLALVQRYRTTTVADSFAVFKVTLSSLGAQALESEAERVIKGEEE
jgi:undecaprenyl-diphosphatase